MISALISEVTGIEEFVNCIIMWLDFVYYAHFTNIFEGNVQLLASFAWSGRNI